MRPTLVEASASSEILTLVEFVPSKRLDATKLKPRNNSCALALGGTPGESDKISSIKILQNYSYEQLTFGCFICKLFIKIKQTIRTRNCRYKGRCYFFRVKFFKINIWKKRMLLYFLTACRTRSQTIGWISFEEATKEALSFGAQILRHTQFSSIKNKFVSAYWHFPKLYFIICCMVSFRLAPWKGKTPVNISNIKTPKDHQSTAEVWPFPISK